MPISGLCVHLSEHASLADAAMRAIHSDRRVEVGEVLDHRAAIVVDTQSSDEDKQLWRWLHELDGVSHVDVAFVHFGDEPMQIVGEVQTKS